MNNQQITLQLQRITNALNQDQVIRKALFPQLNSLVSKLYTELVRKEMTDEHFIANITAMVDLINATNKFDVTGIEAARKDLHNVYPCDNYTIRENWGQVAGMATVFVCGMVILGLMIAGIAFPPGAFILAVTGVLLSWCLGYKTGNTLGQYKTKSEINNVANKAGFFVKHTLEKTRVDEDMLSQDSNKDGTSSILATSLQ
ncbi:MAG: hypothetical protein WC627_09085 [Legionella sp.]|jgi:hypothetical protein